MSRTKGSFTAFGWGISKAKLPPGYGPHWCDITEEKPKPLHLQQTPIYSFNKKRSYQVKRHCIDCGAPMPHRGTKSKTGRCKHCMPAYVATRRKKEND